MNALMDVTARAVSFITLIQQISLKVTSNMRYNPADGFTTDKFSVTAQKVISYLSIVKKPEGIYENNETFATIAVELVWVSKAEPDMDKAKHYALQILVSLQAWFAENETNPILKSIHYQVSLPTPDEWRKVIRELLYSKPQELVNLATALQYLPVEIILALGGGEYTAYQQRILHLWKLKESDKAMLLSEEEKGFLNAFEARSKDANALLLDNNYLLTALLEKKAPISFEHVYNAETDEIKRSREKRMEEKCIVSSAPLLTNTSSTYTDPYKKAEELRLCALAFSGGGIRSATFNLGILQGLAKKGVLENFDYLSTVSGGGYIGSWLTTWIKRDGAISKVSSRLNTDRSSDPAGEELWPIKWLRMFSNYFAPNSNVLSIDSWTIGMTWLRNTLMNQTIIFLLIMAIMFAGRGLFEIWDKMIVWPTGFFNKDAYLQTNILILSITLLLPVSLLAGIGMHAYNSTGVRIFKVKREDTGIIALMMLALVFSGAFLISGFLYSTYKWADPLFHLPFMTLITMVAPALTPAAMVTFAALISIAVIGKYHNCFGSFGINNKAAWVILIITAGIAALAAQFCLAVTWSILLKLSQIVIPFQEGGIGPNEIKSSNALGFLLGVPLIIEVFTITVVVRMALLGKYFPDERREWWGRIGAVVHRITFLWLLVMSAALFGSDFFNYAIKNWGHTAWGALGGWITLVGLAVKAGKSSNTSGKGEEKGLFAKFLNLFSIAGPYLFVLGMLVFLPRLLTPLLNLTGRVFKLVEVNPISVSFILAIILGCFAYVLARQTGVNEFSMHHFYRNRLVRAYLGATRRRAQRDKTSNPFTGFDSLDDEKLSKFTNENGYFGPYPILNTALNATQVTELDRQDRKAESFIFSPLFCGFDFSSSRSSANLNVKSYDYAYRQTKEFAYKNGGPGIGTAMAISGAAVNPNQGYHSSPATAFLLTVFNVQMGWWIGNPRKRTWKYSDPRSGLAYIVNSLIGQTNTRNKFLCLSDGGHFDNMGLYELIRRRCSIIILSDAEQDGRFTCEGFANAVRRCRIDFGAEIDIDLQKITTRNNRNLSASHFAIGTIRYAGDDKPSGKLLYIKSSVTGDEPVDVHEYSIKNATFPHQSTSDQFFDEMQFESYRKLGLHIAEKAFTDEVLTAFNFIAEPLPELQYTEKSYCE